MLTSSATQIRQQGIELVKKKKKEFLYLVGVYLSIRFAITVLASLLILALIGSLVLLLCTFGKCSCPVLFAADFHFPVIVKFVCNFELFEYPNYNLDEPQ